LIDNDTDFERRRQLGQLKRPEQAANSPCNERIDKIERL